MRQNAFTDSYRPALDAYWPRIKPKLVDWKLSYLWKGAGLQESTEQRDLLESRIKRDMRERGWLSRTVYDDVMRWGFGRPSGKSDDEIARSTKAAFRYLQKDQVAKAAMALSLPDIGISRISKILGLSNQRDLAIYDSHAANGLRDLKQDNSRLVPIPPGRHVLGDNLTQSQFCNAYEKYIWILRYFRDLAQENETLKAYFPRVSDLEMALFARSKNDILTEESAQGSEHGYVQPSRQSDEAAGYWTLSRGKRARPFWAFIDEEGIAVLTGPQRRTEMGMSSREIDECLAHFRDKGWFPLGNQVDRVKPGGLGEYFLRVMKRSPKFASHFAAVLVDQRRLASRCGKHGAIELLVTANDD